MDFICHRRNNGVLLSHGPGQSTECAGIVARVDLLQSLLFWPMWPADWTECGLYGLAEFELVGTACCSRCHLGISYAELLLVNQFCYVANKWVSLFILWTKLTRILILPGVQFKYIRFANIFIFIWITLTSIICILDLSFGILFGLDYGTFMVSGIKNAKRLNW